MITQKLSFTFAIGNFSAAITVAAILVGLPAHAYVGDNSARLRDQNDQGCHMSPGAAGAPASGANGAGGNQVSCSTCPPASGVPRWSVNAPWQNLHIADEPISCMQSSGQPMVFRWLYKQRYKLPVSDEVPNLYTSDPQYR